MTKNLISLSKVQEACSPRLMELAETHVHAHQKPWLLCGLRKQYSKETFRIREEGPLEADSLRPWRIIRMTCPPSAGMRMLERKPQLPLSSLDSHSAPGGRYEIM